MNTAEERLCAREVGYYPPAPVALDLADFREQISEVILGFASEPVLYVATDGSSRDAVGALGFAIHRTDSRLACGDALQNQSPFRVELHAICAASHFGCLSGFARSRPA